jgi:predicted CopG family antitoxin
MAVGYKTINVNTPLYEELVSLAGEAAEREGLSKVSIAQLIERMKKVYKDSLAD